ncbi:MAG: hypothetical protein D8M61_16330 [Ignavibacteriae bacterium]|nr:hypothetical protein [Ignavibacteriota bacterium]
MLKRSIKITALFIFIVLLISACAPGGGSSTPDDLAGFFMGIWHGWIAPISLIVGFFNPDIRVYELHNTGWWYDFGFYIAIIGGFGGISLLRKNSKKKD